MTDTPKVPRGTTDLAPAPTADANPPTPRTTKKRAKPNTPPRKRGPIPNPNTKRKSADRNRARALKTGRGQVAPRKADQRKAEIREAAAKALEQQKLAANVIQLYGSGRPSLYDPAVAEAYCTLLVAGQTGIEAAAALKLDHVTLMRWASANEAFRQMLAQARRAQADYYAAEVVEISDDGSNDWMDRAVAGGRMIRVLDHEHVQRSKLRVDTRFRLMAKFNPAVYGDSIAVTGADGGPLVERLQAMTDEQRVADAVELVGRIQNRLALAREAGVTIENEPIKETDGDG